MNASEEKQAVESFGEILSEALAALSQGLEDLLRALRKSPELRQAHSLTDLEGAQGFLRTLELVGDTMSEERFREAIRNLVKSIQKSFDGLPRNKVLKLPEFKIDRMSGRLDFLCHVIQLLGPDVRVAGNEMKAWIRIDPDEGALFTPERILESLGQRGTVFGVDQEKIREVLTSSLFGEEVCVARGKAPVQGRDGYIEYKVNVEDLGRTPKILHDGNVSFKDIELFTYVSAGDTLAVKIPPKPGTPGSTVTGRMIQPLESREAEFPECDNTRISEDGKRLLATIDGAVTKQAGKLVLEPAVRVSTDVSYETGNIDSKVVVLVGGDVRSGFSVRSERDICVDSVVEAAQLEARGNITVRGGIEGGGKGQVEANGNIAAKFISNSHVTSLESIIVESGIIQSRVWAGKRVIVSGQPAEIIGGEVEADEDVLANVIGSDMGVKTVVRLGSRLNELERLLEEVQERIAQQEEAVEKCAQIIDGLQQQIADSIGPPPELQKGIERAREMMATATENHEKLIVEQEDLQAQYDESLQRSRTVRARKNIMPGTVIQILGAELAIKRPTGPATVVKYGDELSVFPFRELEE